MATNKNGAAVAKADTELDKLYKNYDILVNAKDKIAEVILSIIGIDSVQVWKTYVVVDTCRNTWVLIN